MKEQIKLISLKVMYLIGDGSKEVILVVFVISLLDRIEAEV